ncbi:MAG: SxtJ family membrane protein [Planctomycetota bacterium]|jgi:hypothetical protein
MSLMEIKWNQSRKELRNFGRIALLATAAISVILYVFKGVAIHWVSLIFAFGFAIFVISIVSTEQARTIYLSLTLLVFPIGYVVSFIVQAIFYFLLITPLALVFRLIGRDSLRRKSDLAAKSYWIPKRPVESISRYLRQF